MKPFSDSLCPVDRGGVILEETTPIQKEMFNCRLKLISEKNFWTLSARANLNHASTINKCTLLVFPFHLSAVCYLSTIWYCTKPSLWKRGFRKAPSGERTPGAMSQTQPGCCSRPTPIPSSNWCHCNRGQSSSVSTIAHAMCHSNQKPWQPAHHASRYGAAWMDGVMATRYKENTHRGKMAKQRQRECVRARRIDRINSGIELINSSDLLGC